MKNCVINFVNTKYLLFKNNMVKFKVRTIMKGGRERRNYEIESLIQH